MSLTLPPAISPAAPSNPAPHQLLTTLQGQRLHPAMQIAENLEESHLFSAEGLQKIAQFKEKFALLDPEIDREDISLLICFLLCDGVRDALEDEALSLMQIEALLGFDKALVECLKGTLPPGQECNAFIEEFENYSCEYENYEPEKLEKKIRQIDNLFRAVVAKFYGTANEGNRTTREGFEEYKTLILKINDDRRLAVDGLDAQADGHTSLLELVSRTLEALSQEQSELSRRMLGEERRFDILMDELKTLLRKV